ncbi:MAG: NAD(+) diphosphatase [Sphingomonadales bacterium]|nr:NAD(+) diphosphatase [Sphingomonadales bacterium]
MPSDIRNDAPPTVPAAPEVHPGIAPVEGVSARRVPIWTDPRPGLAFAGSGLERAAQLRGDAQAQARMLADPGTQVLPLWRGRPLFAPEDAAPGPAGAGLATVAPDHPALRGAGPAPIFLALSEGAAIFAQDISAWQPDGPLPEGAAFFDPSEQRHPDLPAGTVFAELRGRMMTLDPRAAEIAATARALITWHGSHGFCAACGAASVVEQAGWQRKCPACGAQHFPRTDPVVIMLITRGNRVLLGRSPGWPEGMYSCLAGFMEPGETLEAAVRREVAEETGVAVGPVGFLASQPWPFPASLMLGARGQALSEEITVDPVEIEDALWVSRERLLGVFAGSDPVIRAPRSGAIAGWMLGQWLADRLD